jgi:hypothetical protein
MKVIKHKDKWYLQSETGYKEILLSTDDSLIKDGVQTIPDEFLEWFVKNPSCEEVEVETVNNKWHNEDESVLSVNVYGLIIPKEEPKQDLDCPFDFTSRCTMGRCDCKPKQETLEEAKKYAELSYYGDEVDAFVRGVKWQKEQDNNKYSDEEVIQLLIKFNQEIQEVENVRGWFKQFKKK